MFSIQLENVQAVELFKVIDAQPVNGYVGDIKRELCKHLWGLEFEAVADANGGYVKCPNCNTSIQDMNRLRFVQHIRDCYSIGMVDAVIKAAEIFTPNLILK